MKTITTNLYKFDELSESAQEKAITNWRNNTTEYSWIDEYMNSLKEFCSVTGIDLKDWSISPYNHSYIKWEFDGAENINSVRLATWLINNWMDSFEKGKYYSIGSIGSNHRSRYSKIQMETCCPLTGYCGDDDLIYPVLEFIKKPDNSDINDIIGNCMDSFIKSVNSDCESQDSDEYIKETIEANDYDFTIDGELN